MSSVAVQEKRGLLAVMDREELKKLLYGPVERPDQKAALELIAEETGVPVEALVPATGEIAAEEETPARPVAGGAAAVDEIEGEPSEAELKADGDEDDFRVQYWSDVAEVLNIPPATVDALMGSPDPRRAVLQAWMACCAAGEPGGWVKAA